MRSDRRVAYYRNGYVYSSELVRGLDVLELLPRDQFSANDLAAAIRALAGR